MRAADFNPFAWRITVKVPLVVAALMIAVSGLITNRVLERLSETQERHLEQLATAYLDGLATSILPFVLREDVWEVVDALDRAKERYKSLDLGWTTVTNPDGQILGSSKPTEFKSFQTIPKEVTEQFSSGQELVLQNDQELAYVQRPLIYQDRIVGKIYSQIGIRALNAERSEVFLTLIITNIILTLLIAALGYFTVQRMVSPIRILSEHLESGLDGPVEAIPESRIARQSAEFARLFRSHNAMVQAVNERELLALKLSDEEKLASLGRLASGLAHEINNPLGGMFNALDALKRHGERNSVRETSIRLIERGLSGIRDLVRSTLVNYRGDKVESVLRPGDLDDLRLLIHPELKRKALKLEWKNGLVSEINVPVGAVRDAVLNLLLNACAASPQEGKISFQAIQQDDRLVVKITDHGPGLPINVRNYIDHPDVGSAPIDQRGGLGLWMVKRLASENGGEITATDNGGLGTSISFIIKLRRKELKDVA